MNKNNIIIIGASFALYNTARIATIITKYNEKVSRGDYPNLPDIKNVDFSQLQEEVSIVFKTFLNKSLYTFLILQILYSKKIAYFYNLESNIYIFKKLAAYQLFDFNI